ncbi:MAG TPA: serine hydrolase domain-containing protein [Stackebrandtia sp.]|jgi:D-alanyl-D-alanine carboxypeptidase|uniref:serine hydrolase domain-containing protein n=1 Tax=Stackebrandtia sp. TaxID=2023065 RepID=UPI002D35DBCD|nr:serine hydrolase domain-containing protein [Stackebrandtia sp.]HZE41817.1 serine hydrolase domain-containing protein [Stackebrandtia sp.]
MRPNKPLLLLPVALVAVALTACGPQAAADAAAPSSDAGQVAKVRHDLDALVSDGALVGGEVVMRDAHGTRRVTAGLGERDPKKRYPGGGHVRVASVTKAFTAAMILQLVDSGRVDLDASVETYLPGVVRGEGIHADEITVRQLLRHQSGLPEVTIEPELENPTTTYTPRGLLDSALGDPAQFEPGAKMVYTNTNYVVAGMIIEKVTGHDYRTELSRRITVPLGLDDTALPATGDTGLPDPHPHGYHPIDGRLADVTAQEPSALYASGGVVSTGADLNRFFLALENGKVIPKALLGQLHDTVPFPDVPGVDYGLGVMRFPLSCDVTVWGQAGDIAGFQAMVGTTGERAVSIMMNQSPTDELSPAQLLHLLDDAIC